MKKEIFQGAAVALITPFTEDGINFDELARVIEDQIAGGTDAIVITGTTGESATMTDAEHRAVIKFACEQVKGRIPVIAGTGSNETAYAIQLSQYAESVGADALLVVTPYYNKCTQAGLIAHYTAAADTLPCPVIVYNVPSRTGVDVSVETCRVLAGHPNIGGIKEASGSVPKAAHILDACGDELPVWSGNDDLTVPLLSLGAKGVISVLSNVRPKRTLQMVRACQAGDYAAAGRMQVALTPLIDALFSEINPIPVKQALSLMGIPAGLPRLPLTPLSATHLPALEQALSAAPEP